MGCTMLRMGYSKRCLLLLAAAGSWLMLCDVCTVAKSQTSNRFSLIGRVGGFVSEYRSDMDRVWRHARLIELMLNVDRGDTCMVTEPRLTNRGTSAPDASSTNSSTKFSNSAAVLSSMPGIGRSVWLSTNDSDMMLSVDSDSSESDVDS